MFTTCKKFVVITAVVALFGSFALAHEKKGTPKPELKILFPKAQSFVAKPVNLSDKQSKTIEKTLQIELKSERKSTAYIPVQNGRSLGMAWLTHGQAPKGAIDVGVAVNSSGSILKVALFDLKDKTLNNPRFLGQFSGKSLESKFDDIKVPKGKEAEGKAIVSAVRKALFVLDTVIPHTKKHGGR